MPEQITSNLPPVELEHMFKRIFRFYFFLNKLILIGCLLDLVVAVILPVAAISIFHASPGKMAGMAIGGGLALLLSAGIVMSLASDRKRVDRVLDSLTESDRNYFLFYIFEQLQRRGDVSLFERYLVAYKETFRELLSQDLDNLRYQLGDCTVEYDNRVLVGARIWPFNDRFKKIIEEIVGAENGEKARLVGMNGIVTQVVEASPIFKWLDLENAKSFSDIAHALMSASETAEADEEAELYEACVEFIGECLKQREIRKAEDNTPNIEIGTGPVTILWFYEKGILYVVQPLLVKHNFLMNNGECGLLLPAARAWKYSGGRTIEKRAWTADTETVTTH